MEEKELFYRNVMISDERDEATVRAIKGYGTIVEIILEGDLTETTIRLSGSAALSLGRALTDAADAALRS